MTFESDTLHVHAHIHVYACMSVCLHAENYDKEIVRMSKSLDNGFHNHTCM